VDLPVPQPGLVIRYAYLWRSEEAQGREEGVKDRPCAVVLASQRTGQALTVVVAPITHALPRDPGAAVEIPATVKARLTLDPARSWIITSEVNVFRWPGADIRPIDPRVRSRGYAYGYLPSGLTRAMIDGVRDQMRRGLARIVGRN
jgi:mRNA-degrading endonuclease toxin of MazEF toxin-antitoxin module